MAGDRVVIPGHHWEIGRLLVSELPGNRFDQNRFQQLDESDHDPRNTRSSASHTKRHALYWCYLPFLRVISWIVMLDRRSNFSADC
jgi:hypothetical protein